MIFISNDAFAGKEKIFSLLEKYGGKYVDDLFRYLGLLGLLAFMKAVSWSKMLFGGFLSLVGAFYPNSKKIDRGEAHIEVSKFKFYVKGSIKFALIIVGAILIIGSIMDGIKYKDEYYPNGYIGIQYMITETGLSVTNVLDKSPAQKAGIKIGCKIIGIDNVPVKGKKRLEIVNMMKGMVHSSVKLEIIHEGKIEDYVLQRGYINDME